MRSGSKIGHHLQNHKAPPEELIIRRLVSLFKSAAPNPVCIECIFWSIAYADRRDLNMYMESLIIERRLQWQIDRCAFCGEIRKGASYLREG